MKYLDMEAVISECGTYRYLLTRQWTEGLPRLVYVMLNPSKADSMQDDATIKKCVGIADHNGYGGILVVNLFAFRATDCTELKRVADPFGPENDDHIHNAVANKVVVCAWGDRDKFKTPRMMDRPQRVMKILDEHALHVKCLRRTNKGDPYHPLMLPFASALMEYE